MKIKQGQRDNNRNKTESLPVLKSANSLNKSWIVLSILIIAVTIIRIRLIGFPLERDEGEYAYMGQLILRGTPPYQIAYNMKFPGTYYMYAFFMSLFGQSITGIHLGLLVVNIISIILLFMIGRKLVSEIAAVSISFAYASMSLSLPVFGFAAHATHFVVLFMLGGVFLLIKAITEGKNYFYVFGAGLLLGLSPIMKQQGLFFPIFGGLFLFVVLVIKSKDEFKVSVRQFLIYLAGAITPMALMLILIITSGVFDKFWFWTIQYSMKYSEEVPIRLAFHNLGTTFIPILKIFSPILITSVFGLFAIFIEPRLKKNQENLFIFFFFIFSLLTIIPGFYFREHYYITLFPAVAILFGISIDYFLERSRIYLNMAYMKYISYGILIISCILFLYFQSNYLFIDNTYSISKTIFGSNPFSESIEVGKYIESKSIEGDKIAILGSEPQILFYSNRPSVTGYIYTYSLMENQSNGLAMQHEMTNEIERDLPKYFIYVSLAGSWLMKPESNRYIFNWIQPFLQRRQYRIAGIVELFPDQTIYKWDGEAERYKVESPNYIVIYKGPH